MKKVININFQGQVIAIEETAYEVLKQYIGSLKIYFSREEGGEEIVNDIESRIAELFGNRLKHGINCITHDDVDAIIGSIGRPQDFDSDYEEAAAAPEQGSTPDPTHGGAFRDTSESRSLFRNSGDKIIGGVCSGLAHYFKTDPVFIRALFVLFFGILFWVYIVLWIVIKPKVLESNVSKRLYRNPNDRYIGGVCGGIAAYFRIDAWIPRVLFLVPFIVNMIGIFSFFPLHRIFDRVDFNWNLNFSVVVVYVILWAIIPVAKTVKQKLEMMGEEDYIRSIREKVTDNVTGTKSAYSAAGDPNEDRNRVGGMPPEPPKPPFSGRHTAATASQPERSGCLNAIVLLLKIVFFSFMGIFLLALISVFVGLLVTGTHLTPLKSLFIDPGYETSLLWTVLGLLFLVPVISVITWIIRRATKAKSRPVIGVIASLFWIGGLVVSVILGVRIADKYSVESSGERTVPIVPIASAKMIVEMQPYTEDYTEFKTGYGPGAKFDGLPYTTVNKDSLLFNKINLQIGKSSDSLFHVRVISAIHGNDLRSAKANIAQFSYEIVQKDSLLLLPEFLSVPMEQGFRNQSITVEISVPAGKTIEMSESLREYKDNRPPAVARKRIRKSSGNTNYTPVELPAQEAAYTTYASDGI